MPTVATAAVRGANRTEESLAGDGELKLFLFNYFFFFLLVRFYIPLMSAPLPGGRNSK